MTVPSFHSIDVDIPTECDDEYWFTPSEGEGVSKPVPATFNQSSVVFKQPPGKPSLVTAFVLYLRLHQVLAVLLRTIVCFFFPLV